MGDTLARLAVTAQTVTVIEGDSENKAGGPSSLQSQHNGGFKERKLTSVPQTFLTHTVVGT